MIWASPLQWPAGQPRAPHRRNSAFQATIYSATTKLQHELRLLGASNIIATSNLKISKHLNRPLADQKQPDDRAVAIYFELKGHELCVAVDRWAFVEDNIHAIALSIGAIRGLERWGGGDMVERSFQGFTALPAGTHHGAEWWHILDVPPNASREMIDRAYRRLALELHPDKGGDPQRFVVVQTAYERALAVAS
jgi:hypothetical protein